jgi:predicted DNA-binding protein
MRGIEPKESTTHPFGVSSCEILDHVFTKMQDVYMVRKNAAVTLRLPDSLKRRLAERAKRQHRSLSAQLVHDLETSLGEGEPQSLAGRFLGLYAGSRLPTDEDIKEVRSLLWGRLGSRSDE